MATQFEEEVARAGNRPQPTPEQQAALQYYLSRAATPQPQNVYPGMVPGYSPPPSGSGLQPGMQGQAGRAEAATQGYGANPPPAYGAPRPSLEALLQAERQPLSPFSAPPAQGAAQQFMGIPGPAKAQDRLPAFGGAQPGVKGDPWQTPGGAPAPQGGEGAPSGGGAPSQPQGPLTLQGVMQSLAQANPEMMKTKEGRITLGMAAVKFAPLMRKDDQQELQHMKLEMSSQIQMLKLAQREQEIGIKQQRADDYAAKGGSREDKLQKEYDAVSKQANDLANHLAANRGDPNLKARYDATMLRLKALDEQVNPPEQSKVYADWIKSNPSRIEESIPEDVKRILNPQEFKELLDRQRTDPDNAHARVKWLQQKVRSRESTMEKSYGNN